jgi:hypothetical protein
MQKVIDLGLEVPSTTADIIKKIKSIFFDFTLWRVRPMG